MDIAILTLERYWMLRNYGTLMQCYALQTVLKRLGHKPVLIQRLHAKECKGRKAVLQQLLTDTAHPVATLRRMRDLAAFRSFRKCHITATPKCYTDKELASSPPAADCYLCGSDQVWSHCGAAAFLSFAPAGKRIAYAPSAPWAECDDAWKRMAAEHLPHFAAVSVREDAGAELCQALGIPATVAMDPVLLLDAGDYAPLMPPPRQPKPYLLVYALNLGSRQDIMWDEICRYAEERKMKVAVIARQGAGQHFPADMVQDPSPGEFLRLFADAACVVTNSFHGTAFSLLFGKPFAAILQQGKSAAQNPRFLTLLARTGQQHRLLRQADDLPQLLQTPCSPALPELESWRAKSLTFLQAALDKAATTIP